MDATPYLNKKKITVVGLGLLGRGLGDVRYLAEHGADLIVTDLKSEEELRESVEALKDFPGIRYTLGRHELADFEGRDLIVNGPAVPKDSPFLLHARSLGTPITMSTALFARLARDAGVQLIGVTGTRGKTTTAYMLYEILKVSGKDVLLGGNVQGVSTLSLLPRVAEGTVVVLELDSWQLQGFAEEALSPELAVFTTFYPDHLNYYHNDLTEYLADKANIFLYQGSGDTVVLGEQVSALVIDTYGERIDGKIVLAGMKTLPPEWELVVPGEHNRYNAALALASARVLGVPDSISQKALESFLGVPGRLELVEVLQGVAVYNDTTSTTPEAAIAALHALGHEGDKRIILIMGGADKGLDMEGLLALISETTKHVSLLSGTGTNRIKDALPGAAVFDSLEDAWKDAIAHAVPGDSIVLSPAFASFGMFRNEYERGEQFTNLVRTYGS